MTTIGITGIDGLIGRHLHAAFMENSSLKIVAAGHDEFQNASLLEKFASSCDAIVHLAGKNRGDDAVVEETNVRLARALVDACRKTSQTPHIFFASSAHIALDTAYARSKRRSTEIFRQWALESGGLFTNLVLPHIFGEGGKPFYNSVVSTFCHQLAEKQEPTIIKDAELELVHAQELAPLILGAMKERPPEIVVNGHKMLVSDLLRILRDMDKSYRAQVIPDLRNAFHLRIFNTYRHYLFPRFYPVPLKIHLDHRGGLFEAVKEFNGGQTFISTSKPGIVRGNHFHLKKIERFLVVEGRALIRIRRLFQSETQEFIVSGETPCYVDMPTMHAHNIANTGSRALVTLFWSNEIFDPQTPDTIPEPV